MPKDILDMEYFLQSRKFSLTPHNVWKLSTCSRTLPPREREGGEDGYT